MSELIGQEEFKELLADIEEAEDFETFKKFTVEALRKTYEHARRKGVLSNTDILNGLETGDVVMSDFKPENLNGSSYDVTLGEYFYTTDKVQRLRTLNTRSESSISQHFEGPHQAITNAAWAEKYHRRPFPNIGLDEKIIVLEPGERILAHTEEFIGAVGDKTTQMQSRSTAGRLGIATCFCAGWGDPGFVNRWTMEVYNLNDEQAVLVTGDRVSQIIFSHTGEVQGEYSSMSGNYQKEAAADIETIMRDWDPSAMLPKTLGSSA